MEKLASRKEQVEAARKLLKGFDIELVQNKRGCRRRGHRHAECEREFISFAVLAAETASTIAAGGECKLPAGFAECKNVLDASAIEPHFNTYNNLDRATEAGVISMVTKKLTK